MKTDSTQVQFVATHSHNPLRATHNLCIFLFWFWVRTPMPQHEEYK